MTNEQQKYNEAMKHILQNGEFGCCRNPYTSELEFRMGDGHSTMWNLPPIQPTAKSTNNPLVQNKACDLMASVFDVAKYILKQAGEMSTWKLQKLCYYSQAWSLAWTEHELFSEEF